MAQSAHQRPQRGGLRLQGLLPALCHQPRLLSPAASQLPHLPYEGARLLARCARELCPLFALVHSALYVIAQRVHVLVGLLAVSVVRGCCCKRLQGGVQLCLDTLALSDEARAVLPPLDAACGLTDGRAMLRQRALQGTNLCSVFVTSNTAEAVSGSGSGWCQQVRG